MVVLKNLYDKELSFKLEELKIAIDKVIADKLIKKKIYLYLVNNDKIKELNKKFLKKDKPTNVLSFPSEEKNILGEVFISIDFCKDESETTGLSPFELVVFYFIHSVLHLIGYDHVKDKKEEERMRKEELRIFKKIFPALELEDEA